MHTRTISTVFTNAQRTCNSATSPDTVAAAASPQPDVLVMAPGTPNGATYTISGTPAGSDVITTTSPPSPGNYEVDVIVSDSQTSFGRMFNLVVDP